MRSAHGPKACITGEACITHEVRSMFRKERITQKSPFCPVDKRDFFVGAVDGTRLHRRPGMDGDEGVMPVEPGMSNSPPDCCI